ncbi:FkbM family methyltransferase [Pedobacter hiemivivus]|uniref:FkbM family methyltransferase n=1 Tax=Pedobacter hiemivivus TaxID=2530454 RepID=A0A4R0NEH2_9SPHI|nr:FkbM family methyltransferase [Pedobacter hiemivivus]TCC97562.1 FkbM family methyltransferase [Pedobacter hiemivivus]
MGLRRLFRKKKIQPKEKQVKVGNYSLLSNYEHPIEEYLTQFKYYSRNLSRIAKYLEHKYPNYSIIDVGANIGDTIALFRSEGVDQLIHSIEGDPVYIALLAQNLPLFKGVEVHETFLGEESKEESIVIDNTRGTANISTGSGQTTAVVKLDDLVAKNKIENIKLLKTDTDGFDFKILRGSFNTIKRDKPVLFFEYDADYLTLQKDDGLTIFENFKDLGYNKALYYDNFGKFLLSTEISNTLLLAQLYAYINRKSDCAFPYYDVCLFHRDDDDLADFCVEREMEFFK